MVINMILSPLQAIYFRDFPNAYIPDILEEIYLKKIYEPFLLCKKDMTIVDVGANIGLASYYFKDFAREVFAVEPSERHLEALNKMIEFNKINNITVCPVALSNKTAKEKFYHSINTTSYSLTALGDQKDFEEVQMLSFDEFMVRNKLDHIDLLKMDSEGEEGKIFTSDGFKEYAPKIKVIVGEWHDWCNMEKNQFANTLKDLGYEFNWIYGLKSSVFTAIRI